MPKPAAAGRVGAAAETGATNLILRSGFDFNDTSLVLYFDAADPGISGWQSWMATVYDPSTGAAQDSRQMPPSSAATCQVPAKYCRSFGSADGWSLVGGQKYYVTITVTFPGGLQVTSPASAQAAARTTVDPPARPAAQVSGCSCTNALFPTNAWQIIRGSGVGTAIGSYTLTWPDLQLTGFGVAFNAIRTYSSTNTTAGTMGIGWSWTYDIKVIPPASGQTAVTVRAEDGAHAVYTAGSNGTYQRPPGVRSDLVAISGGGWKLVTPAQRTYTFNPVGRLVSVLNPRGHGITLSYTANAITITDAAGRVVTGSLNSAGLLTKLALPDRRYVSYSYTNGMLTSVSDAEKDTWTFGYTGQVLTTIVDPAGRTQLTNTYSGGRVVKQVDASGAATTFAWDPTRQESTTTDADGVPYYDGYRGNTWVYSQNGNGDATNRRYDEQINPNLLVDASGNQTISTYDSSSNRLSMTAPEPFNFQVTSTFDTSQNLTTHTDALGHTARFGYTATDEINSITAPVGDNVTMTYDNRGLLIKTTDPRGMVTTFTRDAAGNLTSQTSPTGDVVTYTYDSSGRLLTKVDPRGNKAGARPLDFQTTYTYDNLDRVVSVLQPHKAHATTTTYDNLGQVVATSDPLNHTATYTYDSVTGRTATVTDVNGGVTSYTYTPAGRQSSITNQAGDKTTMTYDNRGNLATVTSPRGNVPGADPADFTTTYTYDFNGNRVRTSRPYPGGGTVTTDTRFDQLNRATTSIDPLGKTSTSRYDNNSQVVSTADPLGGTTTYGYDANGRPTAVSAPGGGTDGIEYDAAGNVTKSTSATGGVTTFTYSDDNRILSLVDPRGNVPGANPADYTVSYGYDPAGNLTSVTDQLGKTSSFGYDSNNRVTSATDANRHAISYRYLDDDTLQSVVGPDGNTQLATTYSYDNAGNVVSRTDAKGNTRFTYDKLGRVIEIKDPLNRNSLFSYDAEGNVTRSVAPGDTDVGTRTIAYSYDILNRLTRQDQAAGALVYNLGYDANNQVTSLADPSGVRSQSYDDLGRLTSVARGDQSFTYGYDSDGNVASRVWPDGTTITSDYNTGGQLVSLTAQGGAAGGAAAQYTFAYDATGRPTRTNYPTANHMVTDRAYDRAGRLADLNSHTDAGTVARYQITRDPVGNPTGITTTRGGLSQHVAYGYDVFDRVTDACVGTDCNSATGKIAYAYDSVGNRLSQTLAGSAGNTQTTYQYDSASQLTSSTVTGPGGSSTTAYAYDWSGNLTRAGSNTFTYNLDHTLATATVGGVSTSFAYDAQGIQLSATAAAPGESTQTRTWQTDVNNQLPQLAAQTTTTASGSTTQGFLVNPADQTALGLLTGGQTNSYALDTVHGVANVVDPAGNTLAVYDYDPYGNPRKDGTATATNTVTNPIQFAGAYQDSTLGGQYSTLARVYDPGTGRFNGVDPVSTPINQPATSPYSYVGGRATNYRDPSGASPCSSDDNHDNAQLLALDQLAARYGRQNTYGDCPGWRQWRGIPGRISLDTTEPQSNPDILIGLPGVTLLYEVKPAGDQFTPNQSGVTRELHNQNQVMRYLFALAYDTTGRFPNSQPGPDITPASRRNANGTITTIFSGADWKTHVRNNRPTIRNSGIIYYLTKQPPKVPTGPEVKRNPPGGHQNQNQRQEPRSQPTTAPTDGSVKSDVVGDVVLVAAVAVVVVLVIVFWPQIVAATAAFSLGRLVFS